MQPTIYIGTDAGNGGAGLHPLRYAAGAGWQLAAAFATARNVSYGIYSARHDLYYLVDEQPDGALGCYRLTDGNWHQVAHVSVDGAGPCYVALDMAQRHVAVANYGGGSITLFRLDAQTGLPLDRPQIRRHKGTGPVEDRQEGPHAHCACFSPDQRWLYHVDLGTDEILAFPFDLATGQLGERHIAFRGPPGSGPRHLVFHPTQPFAVLASELASTLTILAIDDGDLVPIRTITTLPADFVERNIVGHLSLNRAGDRIYVTNRGHNSIATFAWTTDEAPKLLQHCPSGGASPRAFVLLETERQFLLANEQGGNVTVFDLLEDGTLGPHHQDIAVPGAVFLLTAAG